MIKNASHNFILYILSEFFLVKHNDENIEKQQQQITNNNNIQ